MVEEARFQHFFGSAGYGSVRTPSVSSSSRIMSQVILAKSVNRGDAIGIGTEHQSNDDEGAN